MAFVINFIISTVTKSSYGSISWATVLISLHPAMCEMQCGLSTLPANTRRWPRPVQFWPTVSTGLTSRVCWAVDLAVHHVGGEYKPTPTQCLLNVGPASPVLVSILSALVSTSCWRYRHAGGTGTILWIKAGFMLTRCVRRCPTFSVAPILG